jgi:hypothetical protein
MRVAGEIEDFKRPYEVETSADHLAAFGRENLLSGGEPLGDTPKTSA